MVTAQPETRPTRVPLVVVVLVSFGVVAALLVATRISPGQSARSAGSLPAAVAAPAVTLSRPAINGDSRPPLVAAEQHAVDRLAATSHALPDVDHAVHTHVFGPAPEVPLSPKDATALASQWAAAAAAARRLATPAEAAAAGYVLSSTPAPGLGVHWVNWEQIAKPFDPARPSMLLFTRERGVDRLVGFSYWVQADQQPAGFAGPNDQWHTHQGLCVVHGWVEREEVPAPSLCPGSWLQGDDLWMLHAWVVPDVPNRWGRFAQTNPRLCPGGPGVPDLASCTPDTT